LGGFLGLHICPHPPGSTALLSVRLMAMDGPAEGATNTTPPLGAESSVPYRMDVSPWHGKSPKT